MKRTLLATLVLTMFAGCAGLPAARDTTDTTPSSSNQTTSFAAQTATALERIFQSQPAPELQATHAQALAGDREAMFRMAQMFRDGSGGMPRDEAKMVSWLRQASQLDHKVASYQLYQHYLDRGLDRHAVHYEKLALRQGYVLPSRLDPRRG
jgi:TPR repeat protein